MTFLQFWLVHKTSSLLTCDVCSRRGCCWLCPASTNPVLGCSCVGWHGWGCCTFHLQPQLHLRIKGVVCWRERYLQTPRRCLNEPLSLPRRCLLLQAFSHLSIAPAAKWAQNQLPAHGRGIESGANSDRHHLPNFQVNNRPRQQDTLIWLLYLTASKTPLRRCSNANKA